LPAANQTARKLAQLEKLLAGSSSMLVVLQDNPDPDALAAAVALRKVANARASVACSLTCGGVVGRAENRALVHYLELNLRPVAEVRAERFGAVALVDTQPGTGNNSLVPDARVDIVIDHHPRRRQTRGVPFTDIRSRYGATSTILYEYLVAAGITPETALATGLLYGIRSDTQDLGRETTQADVRAYEALYPLANKRALAAIQRGQVPTEYFRMLARALASARLCGTCIFCELGDVDNPDMIGEVADLMLRHELARWSLCWGFHDGAILLSVRTSAPDGHADSVMRRIVSRKGTGGGHRSMAGGQIPLAGASAAQRSRLDGLIRRRFLKATGNASASSQKLV